MRNQFFYELKEAVKYWWFSLLIGILAVIVGIWCLATPDTTLVALTYVFMVVLLASGIFEMAFAVSNRKLLAGWGWSLTAGIMEILLALLLLILPLPVVMGVLIYLVGFWILFRSFWTIGESFMLQNVGAKNWGWMLALGILTLLFSFLYFLSPVFGGLFIVAYVGIAFILYGIFRMYLSFQLRSIHKKIERLQGK